MHAAVQASSDPEDGESGDLSATTCPLVLADGNPQYDLSALLHTDTPATKAPMDRMDLTAPTVCVGGCPRASPLSQKRFNLEGKWMCRTCSWNSPCHMLLSAAPTEVPPLPT